MNASPAALVVARNEEDRILLRALLRIHHIPVDGEAPGATQALQRLQERPITHLVVDSDLADGDVPTFVADAQSARPTLRIVVLTRSSTHLPAIPTDPNRPPIVPLVRPFRFRQFAEALGVAERVGNGADPAPPESSPEDRSSGR